MRRAFFGSGLVALLGLLALLMMPAVAVAQTTVTGTEPDVVNVSAGNQTDSHVSGDLVAYTNAASFVESEIRYHDIASGSDAAIPNGGAFDFLSDVSGNRIVFTRFTATASSIFVFDVTTGITTEVNLGGPGTNRVGAAIGGDTVAYVDQGLNADAAMTEIVVVDLTIGLATRLTTDSLSDSAPAVSPDGSVVVWTRCNLDGTGCDVVQAVGAGGAWTTTTLTGAGEEGAADSDGTIVVYDSLRSGAADRDVFYQPVGGGAEVQLALAGTQRNPAISGGLVAFEDGDGFSFDIFVYDTRTGTLHQITNSADDETLSDIFVGTDGLVRVVFTRFNGVDFDVHAFTFGLPSTLPPADQLADLIAQLQSAPVGAGEQLPREAPGGRGLNRTRRHAGSLQPARRVRERGACAGWEEADARGGGRAPRRDGCDQDEDRLRLRRRPAAPNCKFDQQPEGRPRGDLPASSSDRKTHPPAGRWWSSFGASHAWAGASARQILLVMECL